MSFALKISLFVREIFVSTDIFRVSGHRVFVAYSALLLDILLALIGVSSAILILVFPSAASSSSSISSSANLTWRTLLRVVADNVDVSSLLFVVLISTNDLSCIPFIMRNFSNRSLFSVECPDLSSNAFVAKV